MSAFEEEAVAEATKPKATPIVGLYMDLFLGHKREDHGRWMGSVFRASKFGDQRWSMLLGKAMYAITITTALRQKLRDLIQALAGCVERATVEHDSSCRWSRIASAATSMSWWKLFLARGVC
jgi:hypothetical protein